MTVVDNEIVEEADCSEIGRDELKEDMRMRAGSLECTNFK